MTTAQLPPVGAAARTVAPGWMVLDGSIWRGPLVPLALAVTAGIVYDRHAPASLPVTLLFLLAFLLAAVAHARKPGLALLYLWLAAGAAGAARHHLRRATFAEDDVSAHAASEPRPALLRGAVATEPAVRRPGEAALRSFAPGESTRFVLRVAHLRQRDDWEPVSGRALVTVLSRLPGIRVGDAVEVVGRLALPEGVANPGGFDYASYLKDQGITAVVTAEGAPGTVTLLAPGNWWSPPRLLAAVRSWARQTLDQQLPEQQARLATALLLGDAAALSADEWERYQRSGVVHVLVISGQHMVLLAWALWLALRPLGVTRRGGAVLVALATAAYALLAGGQPPAVRGAVMIGAVCGSLLVRRPPVAANCLALAWLVVALANPADVFDPGCQLSFLAVAVLCWGGRSWKFAAGDPLDHLVKEGRPAWQRAVRGLGAAVGLAYAINAAVWLALTPLLAHHFHMVQPAALLLGPPVVLLATLALVAGFVLLFTATLAPPLGWPAAQVTALALAGTDTLIDFALTWGWACRYLPDIPAWWAGVFYAGLLAALTLRPLRRRWRWALLGGLGWLALGLLVGLGRPRSDEFRCTFLAVGHGGCVVLETPDRRTLLYDAGALNGPEVTRRHIAPYLWHRGISRIDEVFLSHGDLDHFNGIPALVERFAVGQVTCPPTFPARNNQPVRFTLEALERHGVPVRIVRAGDRLFAGAVTLDVLHPPAAGPEGNENARSLVLLVRHGAHAILLTGDLEGSGTDRVLALPPVKVDVMQAPHHGSLRANPVALAQWARPAVAVSCQGRPKSTGRPEAPYERVGARFLPTWRDGAVAVRSGTAGLSVETFCTGKRWPVPPRP